VANATSLLGDVQGMVRDFSLDQLPKGYVWDLVDYIPRRRGAKLDGRKAWKFLTASGAFSGPVSGGIHAPFAAGTSLLVAAGSNLYQVDPSSGAAANTGSLFSSGLKMNGAMLHDRVYFADATGASVPKYVTRSGGSLTLASLTGLNAPKGSLIGVYKDRLLVAGDPSEPQALYFSPLEPAIAGGPPTTGDWDTLSKWDTTQGITAIWPMQAQILVFHQGMIEKLRGSIPPGTDIDTDMYLDTFSSQVGCNDPASVVGWQENVLWAAPRGVYLSDGATIRSLTSQGGISELWRQLYNQKRAGTGVVASVFLDLLFVSVLTDWDTSVPHDLRPFTLVCDLQNRAWYRFANCGMTAAIPSSTDGEEVWWGVDGVNFASTYQNRLSRFSDMLFTEPEVASYTLLGPETLAITPADQIDGNAVPVLPQVETGFLKFGPEGVKRFRHLYVSHSTETATPTGDGTNKLRVSFRLRPYPYAPYVVAGDIPGIDNYKRYRIRCGKSGYGITIKVEQTIPTWLSRLHDIGVEAWALDHGHL